MTPPQDPPRLIAENWAEPAVDRDLLRKAIWMYLVPPGYDAEGNDGPPRVLMTFDAAQSLLDDLWREGFRPTNNPDQDDALRSHLDDMRTIAFSSLGITKPERGD